MKKLVGIGLIVVLLLPVLWGCAAGGGKIMNENEFDIYRDGKLNMKVEDIGTDKFFVTKWDDDDEKLSLETKRGLAVGDTAARVKELYGKELMWQIIPESKSIEWITLNEYYDHHLKDDSSRVIQFSRSLIDGKLSDSEELEEYRKKMREESDLSISDFDGDFLENPEKYNYSIKSLVFLLTEDGTLEAIGFFNR